MIGIDEEFEKVVRERYPKTAEKILDAYRFAAAAHEGVKRKSGEPYFIHPLAVAKILIENNMDYLTVIAGLLHDVLEDTDFTPADLERRFGSSVAKLVDGVTRIDSKSLSNTSAEDESIQKLILSMGTDIRVILIKLADRLHNMRTIGYIPRDRQIRNSVETEQLFIPIAERLGIRKIRSELQELVFKCLHPEDYEKIKTEFDARLEQRKKELKSVEQKLEKVLCGAGLSPEIVSWPEHYYSIYKKIASSEGINKVYGLMLYKVIVADELDCYKTLGVLHKNFRHLPSQIKDFISDPKPNGYRSLHTVLISDTGDITFKVMIRTPEMDKVCESGVSSIWSGTNVDESFSKRIEKFNKMKEIASSESGAGSAAAFIKAIKSDLFSNVTWVFTPKLKPVCLYSDKPTAIDFAYALHTDIGHSATGAVINGKRASLSARLYAGDIVQILTSDAKKAPSRDWLKVASTATARQKISKFLTDNYSKSAAAKGKSILEKELKKTGHKYGDFLGVFGKIQDGFGFVSVEDCLVNIGIESVTVNQIASVVVQEENKKNIILSSPVEIEGCTMYSSINFPRCCSAVPGDQIVAIVSKSGAVSVHRAECKNAKFSPSENTFSARWREGLTQEFSSKIKIVAEDKVGFAARLFSSISKLGVNLDRTLAKKLGGNLCEFEIGLKVKKDTELEKICKNLEKVDGVKQVFRAFE